MKRLIAMLTVAASTLSMTAQTTADDVLNVARRVNNYFMGKYADPTVPTNVKKVRPSNLWTRAVYYEGLMSGTLTIPTAGPISTNGRLAMALLPAMPTTSAALKPFLCATSR